MNKYYLLEKSLFKLKKISLLIFKIIIICYLVIVAIPLIKLISAPDTKISLNSFYILGGAILFRYLIDLLLLKSIKTVRRKAK